MLNHRGGRALFGNTECLMFDMPQRLLRGARFRGVDKMDFLDNRLWPRCRGLMEAR